jgi:hypothetical protein
MFKMKNLNKLETEFAIEEGIDFDILRAENLRIEAIAKAKIIEKIGAFEKNMKEALEDNDDTIYQLYGKQTQKNRIKEYENVIKKKEAFTNHRLRQ